MLDSVERTGIVFGEEEGMSIVGGGRLCWHVGFLSLSEFCCAEVNEPYLQKE